MNIFDTGYTFASAVRFRAFGDAATAKVMIALHDGSAESGMRIARATLAVSNELEALLTGTLPSELED